MVGERGFEPPTPWSRTKSKTPWSNEFLRTHGHGVAAHSLHMEAMAIDIRVPGVKTSTLRDAALALHRGGVGYYASSEFVHVDVGRLRRW
jgi:uncharacterized protein YcbK (DUF882 family)